MALNLYFCTSINIIEMEMHLNNTNKNAVIYARGQNKKQIEEQYKACQIYAGDEGLNVIDSFETLVSPGFNERGELEKLLRSVKNSNPKVSKLIILSADRLSRNATNSLWIISEFKKIGIAVGIAFNPIGLPELIDNIGNLFQQYADEMNLKNKEK